MFLTVQNLRGVQAYIEHEIEWEKRVIVSGATELDRTLAKERLAELEVAALAIASDLHHAQNAWGRLLKRIGVGVVGLSLIGATLAIIRFWLS